MPGGSLPAELTQIIDALHQKGIAVILAKDWWARQPVLDAVENRFLCCMVGAAIFGGRGGAPGIRRGRRGASQRGRDRLVVGRLIPDAERVLTAVGLGPGS